jgi:alkanesulfonate monooxygenase SsuD/methylene tetrahydromethanopterin reductase-like flavin-dependent oxidoreductase (luciferase family)
MIRFGLSLALAEPATMIREALLAEKMGFHTIWIPDHLISLAPQRCPDIWIVLAAIGSQSSSIHMGPGVTDTLRRHPAALAQAVASLDHLTGGRAFLGLGGGECMNLTPYGIEADFNSERIREAIKYVKSLWSSSEGSAVTLNANYFSLDSAWLPLTPLQKPHPPIYLGAHGKKMRRLAGEVADGWFPFVVSPESFKTAIVDIASGLKIQGRRLEDFDAVARFFTCVSAKKELCIDAIRNAVPRGLVIEQQTLSDMGYTLDLPEDLKSHRVIVSSESRRRLSEHAKTVPQEALTKVSVYGSSEDCIDTLSRYVEAGSHHLVLTVAGDDREATLRAYGEKIIPHFRRED